MEFQSTKKLQFYYRDTDDRQYLKWVAEEIFPRTKNIELEFIDVNFIKSLDSYKKLFGLVGWLAKLFEITRILAQLFRKAPTVVVFCINHPAYRIYRTITGRKLVYCARTLHVMIPQSFSDRINRIAPRRFCIEKITNNHSADLTITIGPSNRFFFSNFNPAHTIFLAGLPSAKTHLMLQSKTPNRQRERTIYICTQSWDSHGFEELATLQKQFVDAIFRAMLPTPGIRLILRPHPRDHTIYAEMAKDVEGCFATRLKKDDIILTGVSTLAVEAAILGASVIFYSVDSKFDVVTLSEYTRLGIKPCMGLNQLLEELLCTLNDKKSKKQIEFLKKTYCRSTRDIILLRDTIRQHLG